MESDIKALRVTRALCLGGGCAFWILTGYGLYIGIGAVFNFCLTGVAITCTYLTVEITRIIRVLGERYLP